MLQYWEGSDVRSQIMQNQANNFLSDNLPLILESSPLRFVSREHFCFPPILFPSILEPEYRPSGKGLHLA